MKVVVTGAAGHIGNNLVRALCARGVRPRVLVHDDARSLASLDVERVQGNVLDPPSLERAFEGAEVLYHLAAIISLNPRDTARMEAINITGAKNVMAAARKAGVRRVVHFSSIHALSSEPQGTPIDETRPPASGPIPHYDRTKSAGEREVRAAVDGGLDAVIVNPTGVIGPFDFRPSPMGEIFLDLYHRKLPGLVDGGFNWVDVRDVAEGAIAAAERGRTGERYLLAGRWCSVPDLAALVESTTRVRPPRLVAPMWLARAAAPFATAFANLAGRRPLFTSASLVALRNHRDVRNDKAKRELGFAPRPLEETVADVYAWFKEAQVL
jgi:dihydroflavonol-4-reductase